MSDKIRKEQLADNVILYCGDCREIIQTLPKIDAVISDPPYGIENIVEGYGRSIPERENKKTNILNDKNLDVLAEALKATSYYNNNIWLVLFYSCRISPEFFRITGMLEYFGEMIWDKKVLGLGTAIRYQHENIAFFKLGKPESLGSCPSVINYINRIDNKSVHPHEKPNQVMNNICSIVPGKIILDPFMGTGSTGAAAVQLKRGFIGIELERKYFDIACHKVGEALKQPVAFWEE